MTNVATEVVVIRLAGEPPPGALVLTNDLTDHGKLRSVMAKIIARLMNDDGKYHYGASTLPAPQLGPLFGIIAEGLGDLPPSPNNPATPDEHEQWLQSLRTIGFAVEVVSIEEPAD